MDNKQFGRYQIIGEVGRGGMATVYLAFDPNLKRNVALKVLPHKLSNEPLFRARFEREAKLVAALEHGPIVPIYDYGKHEGQLYLVMRYMAGGSLAEKIARGPISLNETAQILQRLTKGLNLAHERKIIHRDLKPGNVLFDEAGEPFLSDFGIAKSTSRGDSTMTIEGRIVGTPCYMSPEQAKADRKIDGRSDIYSLGVIFYEMVTGNVPYEANTPIELAQMHIKAPIPNILAENPYLPARCQLILNKAMAKQPENRYSSASEMALDVERLVQPGIGSIVERLRPHPSRVVWAILTLLLSLVFVVAIGFIIFSIFLGIQNQNGSISGGLTATSAALAPLPSKTPIPSNENENNVESTSVGSSINTNDSTAILLPPTPLPMPVVFHGGLPGDILTLDPQIVNNSHSFDFVENLFINLTNFNPQDSQIVPEAAVRWEASNGGQTYTFHLRDDIPWVFHDPISGETTQVMDDAGTPLFVTAQDFVYSIKRICDPRLNSAFNGILTPVIAGCTEVKSSPPEEINAALLDTISVSAPDDVTLVFELTAPLGYFPALTAMTTMAASPAWLIESQPDDWFEAGTIVTNGRYVLTDLIHGSQVSIQRNPLMPDDLQGSGNIQQLNFTIQEDSEAIYALWLNNEVDITLVPSARIESHREHYQNQMMEISDSITYYIEFRTTKPPFDNVHVRRAFSSAYNRAAFIDQFPHIVGLPARHFAPPGVFGAPNVNDIGIVFNPDFAREQMVEAGYPNCEGFPQVSFVTAHDNESLNWLEFSRSQWVENLGCSPDLFIFERVPFSDLQSSIDRANADENTPNLWTFGRGNRFPDENDWVGNFPWCEGQFNLSNRDCSVTDELIVEARETIDPARRIELYQLIEVNLFGPAGEVPFIPIYHQTKILAFHPWLNWEPVYYGGQHWYDWELDTAERERGWSQ